MARNKSTAEAAGDPTEITLQPQMSRGLGFLKYAASLFAVALAFWLSDLKMEAALAFVLSVAAMTVWTVSDWLDL